MAGNWRGIFTIPCTPFDEQGGLDLDSLKRELDFCIDTGAHGIVSPVNASEFWTLSDDERKLVIRTCAEHIGGRIPYVAGTAGASDSHAAMLSSYAQSVGADAVIAMPPYARLSPVSEIYAYYKAISDAVTIPIFIQNHDAPAGTRLSAELCAKLVNELPNVDYIKEETMPPGHAIVSELKLCGPKLKGIMGGVAGRYVIDEFLRGACGNMPACDVTDLASGVWNLLEAGQLTAARALFNRLLPVLNYEIVVPGVYKAVLKRRGVLRTDYLRTYHGNPLDEYDHRELTAIFADLQDVLTLYPFK